MALHYVIGADDRRSFLRCRRAWDFGALERSNYEPVLPTAVADLAPALCDALAVYYFPGMWDWSSSIVLPLVRKALADALADQRRTYLAAHRLDALPPAGGRAWDECREQSEQLLEAYLGWAPTADNFAPIQVVSELDVRVPDPRQPGRDLVSADGRPAHYRDWADLLVIDEHNSYWLVEHRVVRGEWPDLDTLQLDDRCLSWCWAWEQQHPGMRIEGTVYNELRMGPPKPVTPSVTPGTPPSGPRGSVKATDTYRRPWSGPERLVEIQADAPFEPAPAYELRVQLSEDFRRVQVPRSREELAEYGSRLSAQTIDMLDPTTRLYPNPAPVNCAACHFRQPCSAVNTGGDLAAALNGAYRQRDREPTPGKLGTSSWSMGRGAAPPTFGRSG